MPRYDFFLAHASSDKPWVRRLYEALVALDRRPFFDAESLLPGDEWDLEIPRALADSDTTVVCISPHFDGAWFLRAEVQRAIAHRRTEGQRIVPVYLEGFGSGAPYGLEHVHGLDAAELGVDGVARRLVGLPADPVPVDELALFTALCGLVRGQWAVLRMDPKLGAAWSLIPGDDAPAAVRAAELVQWARTQGLLRHLHARLSQLAPDLVE